MDMEPLVNDSQYCKPLEKNDKIKVMSLFELHYYDDVMEFMLENNCKLEQKIICWLKKN